MADTNPNHGIKYSLMSKYYQMNKILLRVSYHPWAATGINFLGIFTGLLGSLYTKEIKNAFPLQWGFEDGYFFTWQPPIFWVGLLLFSVGFLFRQRAIDNHQKQAHSDLISQTNKLEELVKTVPPANFLINVQKVYVDCHRASFLVLQASKAEIAQLEETIRLVIWSVLKLAKNFDEAADSTRYAGNIMIYRSQDKIDDLDEWEGRIKFTEPENSIKRIKGFLEIRTKLSACSNLDYKNEDDKLDDFVLPVQEPIMTDQGRWRLLPGAPISFCTNQVAIYKDTSTLRLWCDSEGDFKPSEIDKLEEYFSSDNGKMVRSFVSFPIRSSNFVTQGIEKGTELIGVLNIHSEKNGILRGGRVDGNHFLPIMEPFLLLLSNLIAEWKSRKTSTGKWED